jgi:hypothetical protein
MHWSTTVVVTESVGSMEVAWWVAWHSPPSAVTLVCCIHVLLQALELCHQKASFVQSYRTRLSMRKDSICLCYTGTVVGPIKARSCGVGSPVEWLRELTTVVVTQQEQVVANWHQETGRTVLWCGREHICSNNQDY